MYFFITSIPKREPSTHAGYANSTFCSIPSAGIQRLVLPGYPIIIEKSPSFTPRMFTGQYCLGFNGTFVAQYSAGWLLASAYILNKPKSTVWLCHSQLSVSPPNLPMLLGGVPTKRTSV